MRLFLKCLCFFALLFSAACQKKKDLGQGNGKLKVLSTIAMIDDLVGEIGKEHVDKSVLIRGAMDPHAYELVKGDDEKFGRADIVFYNGLGLEHGHSLKQLLERNPKAIALGDFLLKHDPELILIFEGGPDPHIWMDIALWIKIVDPIAQALAAHDPTRSEFFYKNAKDLKDKLFDADEKIFQRLQSIEENKRFLVTSHDAFHYFTRHYLASPGEKEWQRRCIAPEGLAPESQVSVGDIRKTIAHIQKHNIRVLFSESNVSQDALKKIVSACSENGGALRICREPLYADAMGKASNYLEMIKHNVELIARELESE